jgi:hypothetical protein
VVREANKRPKRSSDKLNRNHGLAAAIQSIPLVLTKRESRELGMPVSGSVTSLIPSGGFDSKLFTSLATLASVRGGRFSDDRIAEEDMVVGVGVNPQNNKWKHFAAWLEIKVGWLLFSIWRFFFSRISHIWTNLHDKWR